MSQVTSFFARVSGATLSTVTSGVTTVIDVLPWALSGSTPSYSGSVIRVNNATSGMAALLSGELIYQFDFANHSGITNALAPSVTQLHAINQTVQSGVVVQGAAGWIVTIVYSK